jgi:hypothetical protein
MVGVPTFQSALPPTVLLPESFRGGCSFGAGQRPVSPIRVRRQKEPNTAAREEVVRKAPKKVLTSRRPAHGNGILLTFVRI